MNNTPPITPPRKRSEPVTNSDDTSRLASSSSSSSPFGWMTPSPTGQRTTNHENLQPPPPPNHYLLYRHLDCHESSHVFRLGKMNSHERFTNPQRRDIHYNTNNVNYMHTNEEDTRMLGSSNENSNRDDEIDDICSSTSSVMDYLSLPLAEFLNDGEEFFQEQPISSTVVVPQTPPRRGNRRSSPPQNRNVMTPPLATRLRPRYNSFHQGIESRNIENDGNRIGHRLNRDGVRMDELAMPSLNNMISVSMDDSAVFVGQSSSQRNRRRVVSADPALFQREAWSPGYDSSPDNVLSDGLERNAHQLLPIPDTSEFTNHLLPSDNPRSHYLSLESRSSAENGISRRDTMAVGTASTATHHHSSSRSLLYDDRIEVMRSPILRNEESNFNSSSVLMQETKEMEESSQDTNNIAQGDEEQSPRFLFDNVQIVHQKSSDFFLITPKPSADSSSSVNTLDESLEKEDEATISSEHVFRGLDDYLEVSYLQFSSSRGSSKTTGCINNWLGNCNKFENCFSSTEGDTEIIGYIRRCESAPDLLYDYATNDNHQDNCFGFIFTVVIKQ